MSKVEWDVNCPEESKQNILDSIEEHFEEIFDVVKRANPEEPDHRIVKGLKEYFRS